MNRLLVSILILTLTPLSLPSSAQKLTVDGMKVTNDLSASQYRRADLNGEPCGLVKVSLTARGATFEGSIIEPVEYKTGEYWVYMSKGSRELRIKHPSFVPLHVTFSNYGIKDIQSLTTYNLTLLLPQASNTVQSQKLIIDYSPSDAIVVVDSKPHQGNGHLELDLPIGTHNYQLVAMGYETEEGSVKLKASSPSNIKLTATKQQIKKAEEQKVALTNSEAAIETTPVKVTKENETASSKKVDGYRVQAFAGTNTKNDRKQAESIGKQIKERYPTIPVYVHFYSPRWICRVGNYRTYEEAHQMMLSLREMGFTNALVVKGKITVYE